MKEEFLHYLWEKKILLNQNLKTNTGLPIEILSPGMRNHNAGPDFLDAKAKIGDMIWFGHIEIHVKASDWRKHGHQKNNAFQNIILHVVWTCDIPDQPQLPTLEVKNHVSETLLEKYKRLFLKNTRFIPCEKSLISPHVFRLKNWFVDLYLSRLEHKTMRIIQQLEKNQHDWEATLFQMLAYCFGLKINAESFLSIAQSLNHKTFVKAFPIQKEALLLGQGGLLNEDLTDDYFQKLKREYEFLALKHQLTPLPNKVLKFFRLRPYSFPTIRLSQLAALYSNYPHPFALMVQRDDLKGLFEHLSADAADYWKTHHHFGKISKRISSKKISKNFILLLLLNALIPMRYLYGKYMGDPWDEKMIRLLEKLPPENNAIIKKFSSLGLKAQNALESQALLEMKKHYCDAKKCLSCNVGDDIFKHD